MGVGGTLVGRGHQFSYSNTLVSAHSRMGGVFSWMWRTLLYQRILFYYISSHISLSPSSTTFISHSPGKWHRILFNCSTFITRTLLPPHPPWTPPLLQFSPLLSHKQNKTAYLSTSSSCLGLYTLINSKIVEQERRLGCKRSYALIHVQH